MTATRRPKRHGLLYVALVVMFLAGGAVWATDAPQHVISQAGRIFSPREITIRKNETIQIVNDDGDLLHHVYIDSDRMTFDSGDQKPGSKTNITFTSAGDFNVLCAIHPKMKLTVHVR